MPLPTIIAQVALAAAPVVGRAVTSALRGKRRRLASPPSELAGPFGDPGLPPIRIMPGSAEAQKFEFDPLTGEVSLKKTRRRRRRLLTCSDKADIAFLTGTLGKGALAQTAITSVLARCGS